ncbi:MAG: LptA/OstA family protein [Brevirhabdus sp.]
MRSYLIAAIFAVALPGALFAQGANVAFGGLKHDSSLPVEVTADQLNVDQGDGTAVFTGNVLVGQGEMRLSAAKLRVEYGEGSEIEKLIASGGVTLVNGAEAAEARDAVYTIKSGIVVMTGDVILTQGKSALSGAKLTVNLNSGTGVMSGRVKTILQTGNP